MAPSRFSTAVAAATRSSTGTCWAAMWPPTKLYLGKPFHFGAAGGVSGASRGATSKGAVMAFPLVGWLNCWAKPGEFATALARSGHGAERMSVSHGPELAPAGIGRAG